MIELKTCSYKGVEFEFTEMPTTGGNRLIKFNYPGSNKQTIEYQGKAPRSFVLTAVIPHDDYYKKKDALIRVLEDGLYGILVHPTFGHVDNVINGIYSLDEKISELGRATITIPFEINDALGIPIRAKNSVSELQKEVLLTNDIMLLHLATSFGISPGAIANFQDAITKVKEVQSKFKEVIRKVNRVVGDIQNLKKNAIDFAVDLVKDITSPLTFANKFIGLFTDLDAFYTEPRDAFLANLDFFDYGDDDTFINQTTSQRIERKRNRDALNSVVQTEALAYSYLNAVQIVFDTEAELDVTHEILENQYVKIREAAVISNEGLEQLDRVRVVALSLLDEARVNSPKIITINTPKLPLSVLVYQYYGSTDNFDLIAEINNVKQNAFVEGDIKMIAA